MAKNNSRTTNTIFNFFTSLGGQFLSILMHFIVRTVFIATLGKQYLGINGLFTNILSVLSLAEFGVGNAILFKLYDPIARDDHARIVVLMKFYKQAYRVIGFAVAVIGLALIPFLPYLIDDYDTLQNLEINAALVFGLFLFKTVSSYFFFAYRSVIIQANQKEYYINLISSVFAFLSAIVQIVCLLLFRSFFLYVVILIVQVIGQNIACALLADRMYPYIREKTSERISKEETKAIYKDCGALFLFKLNGVVLKATDNIVISIILGLPAVGEYSNYYIFYSTINTLFAKIYNSVAHSLGNLHTTGDRRHEYKVFEAVMLITALLGGTAFIGIFIVADEFVLAWIGKDWLIDKPFSLLMGLELYTLAFDLALSKYRATMGLFKQAKFRPLAGMIINLVVSVLLVRVWGISGVLVGTIVANWSTMMWFDPIIIHKYGFEGVMPVRRYFFKYLKYFFVVCAVGAADYFICSHVLVGYWWLSVIVHALICLVTVPGVLILLTFRSEEGQYVIHQGKRYLVKIKNRLTRKKGS